MAIQIRRTRTPDNPPVGLVPGQLAVEMANDPARLWVGVPIDLDPSGRREIGSSGGMVLRKRVREFLTGSGFYSSPDGVVMTDVALVGAGGAGGEHLSHYGTAGTDTTFDEMRARGGAGGGPNGTQGGGGGQATGGEINIDGGDGQGGESSSTGQHVEGGMGAPSILGGAGGENRNARANSGSGGGGHTGGTYYAGSGGGAGAYCWRQYNEPLVNVPWSVGVGGAPVGWSLGRGGDGRITITEWFEQYAAPSRPTSALAVSRGFVNKFRNPEFAVAQRGGNGTVTINQNSMTVDGWRLLVNGSPSAAWALVQDQPVSGGMLYGSWLSISSTSVATLTLSQRIESYVSTQLFARGSPQPVTVQFTIFNASESEITPWLSTVVPTVRDNFTSVQSDLSAQVLQSIPAGQMRTVAYTYQPSASVRFGTAIQLFFTNVLGGNQSIFITHADIRATPLEAIGLNDDPPEAEIPDYAAQIAFCQRYYQRCSVDQRGWGNAGQNTAHSWVIPVMRAMPSCSIVTVDANTNVSVVVFNALAISTLRSSITPSASGMMIYIYHAQADAEL